MAKARTIETFIQKSSKFDVEREPLLTIDFSTALEPVGFFTLFHAF